MSDQIEAQHMLSDALDRDNNFIEGVRVLYYHVGIPIKDGYVLDIVVPGLSKKDEQRTILHDGELRIHKDGIDVTEEFINLDGNCITPTGSNVQLLMEVVNATLKAWEEEPV